MKDNKTASRCNWIEDGWVEHLGVAKLKLHYYRTATKCGTCGGELCQNRDTLRLIHLTQQSWQRHQFMSLITKGARQ